MGPVLRRCTFRLHPLPSAAVSAALPRGHTALAVVDVGVGFVDRAAVVVAFFYQSSLILRIKE
jgi:S-adenosylmethionine hydrolase